MRFVEMNEFELGLLKEIRDGRTGFLRDNNVDSDTNTNTRVFQSMYFLQGIFGYITYDVNSDKNNKGLVNVKLTDKGLYYLDPEQLMKDIDEKFETVFSENK